MMTVKLPSRNIEGLLLTRDECRDLIAYSLHMAGGASEPIEVRRTYIEAGRVIWDAVTEFFSPTSEKCLAHACECECGHSLNSHAMEPNSKCFSCACILYRAKMVKK